MQHTVDFSFSFLFRVELSVVFFCSVGGICHSISVTVHGLLSFTFFAFSLDNIDTSYIIVAVLVVYQLTCIRVVSDDVSKAKGKVTV